MELISGYRGRATNNFCKPGRTFCKEDAKLAQGSEKITLKK
jgi:hypothetical protein